MVEQTSKIAPIRMLSFDLERVLRKNEPPLYSSQQLLVSMGLDTETKDGKYLLERLNPHFTDFVGGREIIRNQHLVKELLTSLPDKEDSTPIAEYRRQMAKNLAEIVVAQIRREDNACSRVEDLTVMAMRADQTLIPLDIQKKILLDTLSEVPKEVRGPEFSVLRAIEIASYAHPDVLATLDEKNLRVLRRIQVNTPTNPIYRAIAYLPSNLYDWTVDLFANENFRCLSGIAVSLASKHTDFVIGEMCGAICVVSAAPSYAAESVSNFIKNRNANN